ncbi:unnamed protein product [Mucor hiemalis]
MTENKQVPEWSLQLTEKLMSPSTLVIHSQQPNNNEQFENYIDRQFPSNDATVLKKRLSETPSKATTLRNSSSSIPPHSDIMKEAKQQQPQQEQQTRPTLPHEERSEESDVESNEWWLAKNDEDGFYSISGLLFLFGFLFPPLWWIGSIWPRHIKQRGGKMAERWQKLNRIMSIGFSTVLLILIIVFVILYATGTL